MHEPRSNHWSVLNPAGSRRIVITKDLPGDGWKRLLLEADCRIEVSNSSWTLQQDELSAAVGDDCAGVIGQLTEQWSTGLLQRLAAAGGRVFSLYAVGFDNVDLAAATHLGLPVGNTPGILTEATAEMAVALTFAAARRLPEGDRFVRAGSFEAWLPTLMLGELLSGRMLGIVGAGRIGEAYARMMVAGHKMDLLYLSPHQNVRLERYVDEYASFLEAQGERRVTCRRAATLEELLRASDIVSLHVPLNDRSRHLLGPQEFAMMKTSAVVVNTSRGPVVDEVALVQHCSRHREFRAGLDVYEREPLLAPGLARLDNVVLAPHLGSATAWTREGMARLAAANVVAMLEGWPVWPRASTRADMEPFLQGDGPKAAPSIVNAAELGLRLFAPA
jgi:hydroxypyruvate reductase 1